MIDLFAGGAADPAARAEIAQRFGLEVDPASIPGLVERFGLNPPGRPPSGSLVMPP